MVGKAEGWGGDLAPKTHKFALLIFNRPQEYNKIACRHRVLTLGIAGNEKDFFL